MPSVTIAVASCASAIHLGGVLKAGKKGISALCMAQNGSGRRRGIILVLLRGDLSCARGAHDETRLKLIMHVSSQRD